MWDTRPGQAIQWQVAEMLGTTIFAAYAPGRAGLFTLLVASQRLLVVPPKVPGPAKSGTCIADVVMLHNLEAVMAISCM